MDKTLKGICIDCNKEYMYSPHDKHSIIKSRWVRSARFCSMDCFNKVPKKMQDTIVMYEYLNHQLNKIENKKIERQLKEKDKEKNYL